MAEAKKEKCPVCKLTVDLRVDGQRVPHLWGGKKNPNGCPGGHQLTDGELFERLEFERNIYETFEPRKEFKEIFR